MLLSLVSCYSVYSTTFDYREATSAVTKDIDSFKNRIYDELDGLTRINGKLSYIG